MFGPLVFVCGWIQPKSREQSPRSLRLLCHRWHLCLYIWISVDVRLCGDVWFSGRPTESGNFALPITAKKTFGAAQPHFLRFTIHKVIIKINILCKHLHIIYRLVYNFVIWH